jgi:hypothetical protein
VNALLKTLAVIPLAMFAASLCIAQSPAPPPFELVDARPAKEKKNDHLSLLITSCDYGVYQLGDKRAPRRFELLQAHLAQHAAEKLQGKTLRVPHYFIYVNNLPWARAMVARGTWKNSNPGVGEEILRYGETCPRSTSKGGWFDPAELTRLSPPIVIELTAEIDGARIDVRVLHETLSQLPVYGFYKPEEIALLEAAMDKAAAALVTKLP